LRIKICGLFREQDIDYVNEARPDYCGFVFAESKRQVSAELAGRLRRRLADGITAVGVFVNAPINDIAALYRNGTISIAQLHGNETDEYIAHLKKTTKDTPIPIIKVIKHSSLKISAPSRLCVRSSESNPTDYYLIDSGSGSGETFDWNLLNSLTIDKPWFLAGGINLDNINQAMTVNPYGIDVSSGAETDGVKDREKILQLTAAIRKGNTV
jgi:phosphoribosylanthranilate isomerase